VPKLDEELLEEIPRSLGSRKGTSHTAYRGKCEMYQSYNEGIEEWWLNSYFRRLTIEAQ
jgi:hypothetical protein